MKLFDRRGIMTLPREDYAILLEEAKGKKSVLEFGPGFSTYAFIEAEVPRILCLEYLEKWLNISKERFKDFPQVEIVPFEDTAPVATSKCLSEAIAPLEGQFDLAFVDSPKGYLGARTIHPGQEDCVRLNTCLLALQHAPVVLLHDAYRGLERATLSRLRKLGHKVEFVEGCSKSGLAKIERGPSS